MTKTVAYTFLALIAFAGNSIICRMALKETDITPALFTILRLLSGAIVLMLIVLIKAKPGKQQSKGSWISASMLFIYAAAFSFAYVSLETGTGALILFGVVQITMISHSLFSGNKMTLWEWLGVCMALCGFFYLMLPGAQSPSLSGFILMCLSGIGWGMYSILGKTAKNPLEDTAYNFLRTVPFLVLLIYFLFQESGFSSSGILLAVLSGVVTSGLGYSIWYAALKGLSTLQASVVQLLVPVFAGLGGTILLNEAMSFQLLLSALLILGGILLLILKKSRLKKNS
ncbi:DMT family transporter [Lutimonas sp.]|uniref:DMT family transporter n=1 Tax=Lutimonas sp. TaxID=1872403 RepID=UPI003D9ABDF0